MSLIAGCNSGGEGNNSSNGSSGNGSSGGNTSPDTETSQSISSAGTSLTSNGSETAAATTTELAATTAETARETATQTQTQTAAPPSMQTATPMMTQAAVPMTSSTSSSSLTSTAMGTADSGMATGSMEIDLSDRETYTNDTYSYTIEYPTGWSTTDTDPTSVTFSPSSASANAPANLHVNITEDIPSSTTLQSATSEFLSGYKQSAEQDGGSVEIQNRKQVTLSNGNPAVLLAAQIGVNGVNLRQKLLFTIANSNIYAAAATIPEPAYTSSVDQQSTEMLTSLTISSSS